MRISDWSSDVCSSDLLGHAWPPFPAAMPRWERVLARGTHILFYVLMIGVPLLGGAAASAGEAPPVPLYGVVPAPHLPVPLSHGLADPLGNIHKLMVKSILRILALHVRKTRRAAL